MRMGKLNHDSQVDWAQERLKKVKLFRYLGTSLSQDGELDRETNGRIHVGWKNWKECSGLT